jgi:ribosomal-protein-alanine N-acetyltransferase
MLELDLSTFPTLRTARLRLRQLTDADAPTMHTIRSDTRVMQFVGRPRSNGPEDALALIARTEADRAANAGLTWCIERLGHEGLIGTIGLYRLKLEHHCAEVGYVMSPDHWGLGYMGEALDAVVAHAFERLRFHRVEAITEPRNQRSRQLLERHGFTLEGVQRENYLWNGEFLGSALYGKLAGDRSNPARNSKS